MACVRRRSSSRTSRTTRPGTPMTTERGGIRRFSVTSVPAAIRHSAPISQPGQQQRPHAHEGIPADEAAVQDGPMADDHAFLDLLRLVEIGVDDAAVLQIDARPQGDPGQVAAEDRAEPDVHPRRQHDVAADNGIIRHVIILESLASYLHCQPTHGERLAPRLLADSTEQSAYAAVRTRLAIAVGHAARTIEDFAQNERRPRRSGFAQQRTHLLRDR